jgi:carbonic anhydrase
MRIRDLVDGHKRFGDTYVRTQRSVLARLAEGQNPEALVVCCSDSRVIPELITGAGPGALFVVRNVGNLVPPFESGNASVGAAIDYAVGHLHVGHLIVLGHHGCGGMKALRGLVENPQTPTGVLPSWLAYARPSYDEAEHRHAFERDDWLEVLVEENVLQQLANVLTYPVVCDAVNEGKLSLHAWIYDLDTSRLWFYDRNEKGFVDHAAAPDSSVGEISAEDVKANDNV